MDYGFRARHPYHGSCLMPPHQSYRAQWACQHLCWTQNQWNTVSFSDESQFCLDRTDWRVKCYCRRGEHYSDSCVLEKDCFGGPCVMVWGAKSFHRCSELIHIQGSLTGHRYLDKILAPVVVPFFNAKFLNLFNHPFLS